jgi:hypothetical protein
MALEHFGAPPLVHRRSAKYTCGTAVQARFTRGVYCSEQFWIPVLRQQIYLHHTQSCFNESYNQRKCWQLAEKR